MARPMWAGLKMLQTQTAEDSLADNNGEHAAHGRKQGRHGGWQAHRKEQARQGCTAVLYGVGLVHDFIADGFKDNGRNNTSHHDNGGAHAEVINRSDDSRYKGQHDFSHGLANGQPAVHMRGGGDKNQWRRLFNRFHNQYPVLSRNYLSSL